ncbi:family 10 glycosylhydrolase [Trichocoleus sp. FACHB-591]|uniref:glycoside hydrolase family 10 protein n=1 Tax=Trichocoleus sp. FACHB-591 TaxID=2692872 RepID=UPI00168702A7|nr:family 10 glycosylhydrolase [Trichocoleus sp. FACHB-591]MBD2098707.1 family 10 glycosylhydrolase [Trichocoleus sp. FACHB-591]
MHKIYRPRSPLTFLTTFLTAIAMVIAAGLMTPTTAQTSPTKFKDVQGHWAQNCIENLADQKIISGYPDGSFRPSAPVTRAEFAAMVVKGFPGAVNATLPTAPIRFSDVATNYWAAQSIDKASGAGFMSGYPGRIFRPAQNIPRAQVLVALAGGLGYKAAQPVATTLSASFNDAQAIPDYARNAIAAATEKQIVVNYPNAKALNPNQVATRADVAAAICQSRAGTNQLALIPAQYIAGNKPQSQPQSTNKTSEIRGVWLTNVDSEILFSRDRLKNDLQDLANLKFNTIYPTVWNWGHTLYPSQVAKKVIGTEVDPTPGLQGRDMLAEAVEEGHRNNLAVIPWFEFGFMAPAESDLVARHPDWLTTRQDGSTIWAEGKHSRVWLNPFQPEVQQFMIDLVTEIVTKYDIDGIQFDDHFGLPAQFGYDPITVKLYQQEHQGQSPPSDPKDAEWTRWRADKITQVFARTFEAIKARKPKAIVSLSPNPQKFSYEEFLADWATWERRGLVEELLLQIYRTDLNTFLSELDQPEVRAAKQHIPVAIGILAGLKDRLMPTPQIQAQVQAVRDRDFKGVSFFYYETMWNFDTNNVARRKTAFQNLFTSNVTRPNLVQEQAVKTEG